jgi:hypothetical protein
MAYHLTADDHLGIARCVHRYADAVVHRDAKAWGATWDEDAEWQLGPGREVQGRDAIVELWLKAVAGFAAICQYVMNGEAVGGDEPGTATGRYYIREWFQRANGEVGILIAHYDDAYVRIGDTWRFKSRKLVVHYQGPPDLSGEFRSNRAGLEARGLHPDV